ncbi:hypothetical protein [Nocardia jejuensis]|uniref:hypothetical protein n=1 Tax=Nocardia jejuensis TaxID=328049 RepID=UPI001471ED0E|nr:hypothetical protein [Nocardia jejuensis]
MAFTVRIVTADQLANDLQQWRSVKPTLVSDGTAFVAISPTWRIWYAETRAGLQLETSPLPSAGAARAFLMRSGLLR